MIPQQRVREFSCSVTLPTVYRVLLNFNFFSPLDCGHNMRQHNMSSLTRHSAVWQMWGTYSSHVGETVPDKVIPFPTPCSQQTWLHPCGCGHIRCSCKQRLAVSSLLCLAAVFIWVEWYLTFPSDWFTVPFCISILYPVSSSLKSLV